MELLAHLDDKTLDRLHKFSTQMSTALRTFSKLVISLKKIGTKSPRNGLDHTSDSGKTLVNWIFSKHCGWKRCHGNDLAVWFLGGMYRADRCGNTWKLVGDEIETRSSWRKIPNSQIKTLHDTYCDIVEESKELVENATSSLFERIRPGKRLRKHNITFAKPIGLKKFVEIMKERHKQLPPLRRVT